jgi:hypothetical protein
MFYAKLLFCLSHAHRYGCSEMRGNITGLTLKLGRIIVTRLFPCSEVSGIVTGLGRLGSSRCSEMRGNITGLTLKLGRIIVTRLFPCSEVSGIVKGLGRLGSSHHTRSSPLHHQDT